MTLINGVYPISGENLLALPVTSIGPAVEFYKTALGFTVLSSNDETATLQREGATLGLVRTPGHKPEEAGSFCFGVTDLDAMHRELDGRGLDLGQERADTWDGKSYRVFFLRESENGYCYCFAQPRE